MPCLNRTTQYNFWLDVFRGMVRHSWGVRSIWVLQQTACITLHPCIFSAIQNMAQKINAVLHNFIDQNDVSSTGEDDCSSVESDIQTFRWMSSVMLFVLMENVKMTLPMKMVGLMLMSSMYLSCRMRYYCNDLLKHLRPQMHLLRPRMLNLQQKKPKADLGERWHTPPANPQKGRQPWSFGHKLHALVKLKEANGNQYHV